MLICREPIVRSLTRRCAEGGNLSAAHSGTATLSIGKESAISEAHMREAQLRTCAWLTCS